LTLTDVGGGSRMAIRGNGGWKAAGKGKFWQEGCKSVPAIFSFSETWNLKFLSLKVQEIYDFSDR
jgi:hypothetical protein